jgi:G3E family GTPase
MPASLETGPARPLPMTVVSGYLGAGKTTLVNAILSGDHDLRIAVLVNDFGKIAIDETLIRARGDDVIALANGCMCCQIGGDLYDAIDRILRMRERFDHLLIETSGVADPAKIAQIAIAEPDLELSQTVVLVDAVNFGGVLADPRLTDTLLRQLRAADLILLTKVVPMATAAVADFQILLAELGVAPPIAVLQSADGQAWRILMERVATAKARKAGAFKAHVLPFESWSWTGTAQMDLDTLTAFASDPALNIYRLKGRFHLADGSRILLHKVGSEIAFEISDELFDRSEIIAIGVKPGFDPERTDAAWTGLIKHPDTPREPR